MKLLVTGASGQLGREVAALLGDEHHQVVAVDRAALDFSFPDRVAQGIAQECADWVINCAAYTGVDRAEQERDAAFLVNRDGALEIGRAHV